MELNEAIENHLSSIAASIIGPGSDPTNYVKMLDDHLRDFDLVTENPFLVVSVREWEKDTPSEIGGASVRPNKNWDSIFYFLFVSKDWTTGKQQRNLLVNKLINRLESDPLLGGFSYSSPSGVTTIVWDSEVESGTFDESGEDGYYTFVSEIHLTVRTSSS